MSLPAEWTDKIFKKLILIYGRDFTARWEGMTIADVKTDWSHELDCLAARPKAIAWGLQNLSESGKPPTVLEFRKLCNTLPVEAVPELAYVKAGQERIAAALANLAPVEDSPHGMKAWAHRLKAGHEAGDTLGRFQKQAYQTALGLVV